MAKKPIPRAVIEERLRVLEEKQANFRLFLVRFGVYLAMILGVLVSQAVTMSNDLNAALVPLEIGQLLGAALVSGMLYTKLETQNGSAKGKAKKGNVFRVLLTAFFHGLSWMTLLGAWW